MAVTGSETRAGLRRTVHLTVSPDQPPSTMSLWRPAVRPRRSATERVLLFAERVVGDLAPTVRRALLLVACSLAGLVLITVFAGPLATLVSALVLVVIGALRRQ